MKRISTHRIIAYEEALKDVSRRLDLIDERMARILIQLDVVFLKGNEEGGVEGEQPSEEERLVNLQTSDR